MNELLPKLGPLAALAGIWEGDHGTDIAPSDDRGTEENLYRERISFVPFGPVNNHEQELYGLKYSTMAWRTTEEAAFHEDTGFWLWDAKAKQVMRCFVIPRGISVIAGGTVAPDAKGFKLVAESGSETYGICSNLFLDREFKTVRYEITVTVHSETEISYSQDSQLKMPGRDQLFHHTDTNRLKRVALV